MTTSSIAVSLSRSDEGSPAVSTVYLMEDVAARKGPGRRDILAGDGSTEYTLWTSSLDASGSAFTTMPFERLILAVDPKSALDDEDKGVWVKLYYTAVAGGSSTATGTLHFVTRKCPLVLGPLVGATISGGRVITKVAVFNANASNNVPLILELE
jgi:hypothetical protein